MPKKKTQNKSQKIEQGWVKGKNYPLTEEAYRLLSELRKETKDTMQNIVSKAIVEYARGNGLKVRGSGEETIQSLAKKHRELEKTVKALCRNDFYNQFESEDEYQKGSIATHRALQKAINAGTKRNIKALWQATEKELPEEVQYEDTFRIYIKGRGIPDKEPQKPKKKA